jgi:hypothetical protein
MFEQEFYKTHNSEAFAFSQCLTHERALIFFIESMLINCGYQQVEQRRWQRNNRTIVICFVDDFKICTENFYSHPDKWFDSNTIVITDNWLPFETQYTICKAPNSYFGIYNYVPLNQEFFPDRRFHISMNRLDSQRMLMFFEFYQALGNFNNDYVNFNSRPGDVTMSLTEAQGYFDTVWNDIKDVFELQYQQTYVHTRPLVPIRNHNLSIEQACVRAYLNIVVETYAGDQTVALSEKIFRALVTPAPWVVFSAHHAVNHLRSLGFDVLDDIVDHSYDTVIQDTSYLGIDKIKNFVAHSQQVYKNLVDLPVETVRARCIQAAEHNQRVLANFARIWHRDCINWLSELIIKIQ